MARINDRLGSYISRVSQVINAPLRSTCTGPGANDDASVADSHEEVITPRENVLRRCDSRFIAMVNPQLQREFPRKRLSPTLLFDNPTIESAARSICDAESDDEEYATDEQISDTAISASTPAWVAFASPAQKKSPFTQFVVGSEQILSPEVYEMNGDGTCFRTTDGMECLLLPRCVVSIGNDQAGLPESPCHKLELSSFLMDIEPVSIGAYARFLNIVEPPEDVVAEWCGVLDGDARECHVPIYRDVLEGWRVKPDVPLSWPMIMVSWCGANAYSLWANGQDWTTYRNTFQSFLPTEAQWEYAARGADVVSYPWGNEQATPGFVNVCWNTSAHDPSSHISTPLANIPLVPVNAALGVSPFGLRHMAGNVWQWCRDTYDPLFYNSVEASALDACNLAQGSAKSERGGSWVGPADLARSSYRRGRIPEAMGRCLGFRCVGKASVGLEEGSTTASSDF